MVDQTLLALGTILLLLAAEGTRYFVCTNEERNSKIWEVRMWTAIAGIIATVMLRWISWTPDPVVWIVLFYVVMVVAEICTTLLFSKYAWLRFRAYRVGFWLRLLTEAGAIAAFSRMLAMMGYV